MADAVPRFERKTAFRVTRQGAVNQTFTSGVEAKINYTTVTYDLGNNFDLINDWYVVPLDGIYVFTARTEITAQATAAGRVLTRLLSSAGTEPIRGDDYNFSFGNGQINSWGLYGICLLTAGEQIRASLFAVSGPNQVAGQGDASQCFAGYRIQSESRTILGG